MGPDPTPRAAPPESKYPKLSSSIARLVDAVLAEAQVAPTPQDGRSGARPDVAAGLRTGRLQVDAQGRLQVYIRVSDVSEVALDRLRSLGVGIERISPSGNLVQARVVVRSLPQVAELELVGFISPPQYGRVNVGSRQTQGDALLTFSSLRSTFGIDGAGITVGVISDGIAGLQGAIDSGDLPPSQLTRVGGVLVSTQGGVISRSFRSDGDLEGRLSSSSGAEGTAILEIVHDIAPGAQLMFANFETGLAFNAAVNFLAANSDVVIDDIGFFGGPYDQTSNVSSNTAAALNNSANPIRGYYTSVGNQALNHYEGVFVSGGVCVENGSTCHTFAAGPDTTDALGLGPVIYNPVRVAHGETLLVELTWNDTFGSAQTDYDLWLYDDATSVLLAVGDDNIKVSRDPHEELAWTNLTGASRWYDIQVTNHLGTQTALTLELFVFGGLALANGTRINFNTLRSSVVAQSDSGGGVVSVGAISMRRSRESTPSPRTAAAARPITARPSRT